MTLALPKQGRRGDAARPLVGELYVADIGVPPMLYARPPLQLQVPGLFATDDSGAAVVSDHINPVSVLTCPACGVAVPECMPTDACGFIHDCGACGARLRPKAGDCCVFCSYGSVSCPSVQLRLTRAAAPASRETIVWRFGRARHVEWIRHRFGPRAFARSPQRSTRAAVACHRSLERSMPCIETIAPTAAQGELDGCIGRSLEPAAESPTSTRCNR